MSLVTELAAQQPQYGPSLDEALHLRLLQARCQSIDSDWRASGVRSSFWRLYVNDRDGASVACNGMRYPLAAHHVHVVPAWVPFDCHCRRRVGHLYLHFDVLGLPAEQVRSLFDRPLDLGHYRSFAPGAAKLRAELSAGEPISPATVCLAKALLFTSLARLLGGIPPAQQQHFLASLHPSHGLWPALQLIEQNLSRRITNEELAQACHVSRAQLVRRFRQLLDRSPAQYVLDRRVAYAAQALALGDQTIDQIAATHGFPDRYYFTRVFKRRTGLAPAAYRRQTVI